jgi:hypothetical protein
LDKHKAGLKLGANQQKNIVQKTKTGLTGNGISTEFQQVLCHWDGQTPLKWPLFRPNAYAPNMEDHSLFFHEQLKKELYQCAVREKGLKPRKELTERCLYTRSHM